MSKQPKVHTDRKVSQAAVSQDLPTSCSAVSNVFQWTWQHTYAVLISENIATSGDKRLEFCPHFPVHFSSPPTSLSILHSPFPPALCGGLLNFPSSSYHPLWVGRIFHTAFGLRSVKHLGHRTKYRTGTRRQTQPPAAISSQAILIAGVAVWVIPSVIHYEALSLFPAQ